MTANDGKSYLSYWNSLVDLCNNTYHHSINKECVNADYSGLTEEIETNSKAAKYTDRVRITKYKNIFSKGNTENLSREIFILDSF